MNKDLLSVKKYVAGVRRKIIWFRIIQGFAPAIFAFSLVSAVLNLSFALYPWTFLPFLWDIFVCSLVLFLFGWLLDSVFFHAPDYSKVALRIEQSSNCAHPLIAIALEFHKAKRNSPFIDCTFNLAAQQIGELTPISLKLPITLWLNIILVPAWLFTVNFFNPSLLRFWNAPFLSISSSGAIISPGTVKIGLNDSVTLKFQPLQTRLPSCKVVINRLSEKRSEKIHLRSDSSEVFIFRMDSVKQSFVYQFVYGGHQFAPETIIVVPPPALYSMQIRLTPPSYIGDSARVLPEGQGDFRAYAGTKVNFTIESEELSRAYLISGNDSTSFNVDKSRAYGEIVVKKPMEYTFELIDQRGQKSDSLPQFRIDIIPDELPMVHFLKPGYNIALQPEMMETLWVQGIDDIGIRSLEILSCRNGDCQDSVSAWNISPKGNPQTVRKQVIWNLRKYTLYPGDTLFYWAKIRDNRPFSPPGITTSDIFWFRVPSFEEIHQAIMEKESYADQKIEGVRKEQENLKDMLEQLIKSATGSEELSWDQKQILQDVQKSIQAQTDSLQNALNSLQENIQKLKEQGDIGEEISEKMEQIQNELKELIKQFGDSLFPKIEDSQQISFEEMREAVENLQKMLPELDERLDNTLQFLQMLRKDRELASMAMRAEKLAQEQKTIADQKQSLRTMDQQKDLLNRIENFNHDLKKNHSDEKNLSSTSDQMDSLHNQMQSSLSQKQSPSAEQMNQMSAALLSASQQLRDMMSASRMKQMLAEQKMIMEMAHDALNLIEWQEKIITEFDLKERKNVVVSQQALRDALAKSSVKTDSLKTIPPMIKNSISQQYTFALDNSREAVLALGENNAMWAMRENKFALNSLASTLIKTLKSMKQQSQSQSSCNSGFMDAMRNLSGRQAAINAATADLLKSLMMGSKGESGQQPGQGDQSAREAAQKAQKAIAEELKKLAEKYGKETGDAMKERVEELEKEAQRLAKMLDQPKPEISRHQDRFLSRMLQTTLSMNRQDEGKEERKSKTAEMVFSPNNSVGKSPVLDDPDTFYLLRRKALMGNFPESYRDAIRAYFDSLEVMFLNK
ncbi:MAG: hypothetical protein GX267_10895 [Fibrobacter sp.]|jgi:hypothetical protein|nr:hypothetical protein [Fibrobacter sp.]